MRRLAALAVVAACSVLVGVVGAVPMAAMATDGEMVVTEDTVLAEDHSGTVVIDADDVTLDCSNHLISGVGQLIGIDMRGRTGTTLVNCEVAGYVTGVELGEGASNNIISDNLFHDNSSEGIAVGEATGNLLSMNRSDDNGVFGFLFNASSSNTVIGNTASGNGGPGFSFGDAGASNNNEVVGNTATSNENGFALVGGSQGNTLEGNKSISNLSTGFDADSTTTDNSFVNNLASGNTDGFHIVGTASTFDANHSHDNTYGFRDESNGGSGDAGTDNSYDSNICVGNSIASDPPALCDASGTFSDDDGNTFELDIEWMNREGITKGCNPPTNDQFCPDNPVTRGQMAAFLVRALGYTDNGEGNLFIDDDGNTFEADIDKLATAGVTKGCNPPTNNQYCPDDFVTRGQMAAFLVRALGYTDNGGGDLFIDDDGNTFEADIDKLGTAGVTKGCNPPTNDEYCPNDFVTRGQMAAFLRRALDS